jgi:hypothetical protein
VVVVTYTEKSLWAGPTHKFKIREEHVGGAHQIKKKNKSATICHIVSRETL